ncbi:hypothetical protein KR093_010268 [Drosophila rubida]|uniref:MADF domain-containing protein n=1 Tax=Drosophila rubida TaxID=30044 RepID=A0AAD4PMF3_9MUSC|nr:hypothetical protein KR093_010268 [Drosophila rubida]
MSSSGAAAQYKLDANSNAIVLITDVAAAAAAAAALPPSPSSSSALSSPADRIEWSRATILGFIEDYRRQRVLWDPNTKGYHIKQTKYEALKLLSEKYGTEIRSIRSKIKSLRSSFHREHGKVLNGRNRGVHYQPMWFAYEAIRFILDGERVADVDVDVDVAAMALDAAAAAAAAAAGDVEPASALDSEAADKLALMHSLDLEQLTAVGSKQQQVVVEQQQQNEEFAARIAAAVAAVQAAAVANHREQRDHNLDNHDAATSDANSNGCAGVGSDATAAAAAAASVSAAVVSAYCLLLFTRSSSDLDGENYCNISAEDVKTEIIEHESELGLLDRQTSTPLSLSYFKPTDLTYNPRKRKAQTQLEELNEDECGGAAGSALGIVGGVVGALTLTPIKPSTHQQQQQQQQLQLNHSQIAFHALQQHFSHNHNLSHNGNGQQHFHHQQQHSNSMAQKRDRERDLSSSPTEANSSNNSHNNDSNNDSNNNINNNSSSTTNNNNNNNNNRHSSTSLELATATAASSSSSSGVSSSLKLSTITTSHNNNNNNNNNNNSGNNSSNSSSHVDEYGVFGEYVAITIRKLKTAKSKIVVKHLINNLLYEAELGKYDQGMPASKEPPQLYKMQ